MDRTDQWRHKKRIKYFIFRAIEKIKNFILTESANIAKQVFY